MAQKPKKDFDDKPKAPESKSKEYVLLENAKINGYNREAGWKFKEGDLPKKDIERFLKTGWAKEA